MVSACTLKLDWPRFLEASFFGIKASLWAFVTSVQFHKSNGLMKTYSVAVFLAALAACVVGQNDPNYCFATDPLRSQLNRFSERTAYEIVRGHLINPIVSCEIAVHCTKV